MNIPVNVRMALLSLLLTSAACLNVPSNRSDSREECKDLLCDTRMRYKMHAIKCTKNDSNITIWLKENEGAYAGVLVSYPKAGCEAAQLSEAKSRDIRESCNITESCNVRKELYIEIKASFYKREKNDSYREKQNKSLSGFKRGLKISFKSRIPFIKRSSVLIVIRENENGSVSALVCFVLDKCRAEPDICTCSVQPFITNPAPATFDTNRTTNGSRTKPKLSEEGRNNRKTIKHTSTVFCFVLLCLILEILVYVVLHLWLSEKRRRTYSLEIEISASNPSYQPGLQPLPSSNSPPLPDTGQETYQPPYQSLVESTRGPGVSTVGYRELTAERGKAPKVPAVDPAFYQDLVQNLKRENMNQEKITQGKEVEEPLYYVLEESAPTKAVPRSPRQGSDSSESLRDPLYYVLKELKSQVNANGPSRASSEDSVAEPIYYVLENPRETEENNTQNEKS